MKEIRLPILNLDEEAWRTDREGLLSGVKRMIGEEIESKMDGTWKPDLSIPILSPDPEKW